MGKLMRSVEGVARMVAVGLGLEEETFTDAGRYGYVATCPCVWILAHGAALTSSRRRRPTWKSGASSIRAFISICPSALLRRPAPRALADEQHLCWLPHRSQFPHHPRPIALSRTCVPVPCHLNGAERGAKYTRAYTAVHVWARNSGKRIPVRIPPGCLLVQAGKQIEWMTGGLIKGTWRWTGGRHCARRGRTGRKRGRPS
jgi:hypothetical protein